MRLSTKESAIRGIVSHSCQDVSVHLLSQIDWVIHFFDSFADLRVLPTDKPGNIPLESRRDLSIFAVMAKAIKDPEMFIPVKLCYSHIGGQLGSLLSEHFILKKWIEPLEGNGRQYRITPKGKKAFTEMGIDLDLITPQQML